MGIVLWSKDGNVKEFSILSCSVVIPTQEMSIATPTPPVYIESNPSFTPKRFCSASHCCLPPPVAVDSPSRDVRRCAPPSISIDKHYKYFRQLYCPSAQCCPWATQACHTVPPHQ
ncbi:hypothetical protein TIFTF001_052634 [Ficus carica]|uniref:Uncharacterized protein n=2 Tax=Ficus carica TaxID=3494 RepID=A0AA88EBB5_FICCA|nr:hypothetical protein TIFTF001_052634 [Ficus carica]